MKGDCKFDLFKIGYKDYLLITLKIPEDVKEIKYEILGSLGTYVKRRIYGCEGEITISQVANVDETIVFRYSIGDNMVFKFINYKELIKPKTSEINVRKDCFMIQKNIHMNINYDTEDSVSKDIDFYEESSSSDDGIDDMYKPVSEMEDNEDHIMSMFHLDDMDEEDEDMEDEDEHIEEEFKELNIECRICEEEIGSHIKPEPINATLKNSLDNI